jgi:hypothetical protein
LQWLQTEKTNKGAIQEQKIRCAYVAAEDGGAANGIPEEDEAHEASRLDESVSTQSVLSCFGVDAGRLGGISREGRDRCWNIGSGRVRRMVGRRVGLFRRTSRILYGRE